MRGPLWPPKADLGRSFLQETSLMLGKTVTPCSLNSTKGASDVTGCLVRGRKSPSFVTVFGKSREGLPKQGSPAKALALGIPRLGCFWERVLRATEGTGQNGARTVRGPRHAPRMPEVTWLRAFMHVICSGVLPVPSSCQCLILISPFHSCSDLSL